MKLTRSQVEHLRWVAHKHVDQTAQLRGGFYAPHTEWGPDNEAHKALEPKCPRGATFARLRKLGLVSYSNHLSFCRWSITQAGRDWLAKEPADGNA